MRRVLPRVLLRVRARSREVVAAGFEIVRAISRSRSLRQRSAGATRSFEDRRPGRRSSSPDPAPSISAHLGALVDRRLGKLFDSRNFAEASDPVKALHDLRVASRRLRAFTDVFASLLDESIYAHAKKPLRRVTRAAGTVRDLDVQGERLGTRLRAASSDAERAAVEYVLEGLEEQRRGADRRARRKLGKVDLGDLHEAVLAALGEVVAHLPVPGGEIRRLALRILGEHVAAAETAAPASDGVERPEELHALRIRVKRLRYALELFEPLLGDGYSELHARAEGMQELLGTHHDLFVLRELVGIRQAELAARGRHTLVAGLASLAADLDDARREAFAAYARAPFDAEWWRGNFDESLGGA